MKEISGKKLTVWNIEKLLGLLIQWIEHESQGQHTMGRNHHVDGLLDPSRLHGIDDGLTERVAISDVGKDDDRGIENANDWKKSLMIKFERFLNNQVKIKNSLINAEMAERVNSDGLLMSC